MARIDIKKCTFTFSDGTGTPLTIDIVIGEGNLTYTERRDLTYIPDGGVLDDVEEGDEQPLELRVDMSYEYVTSRSGGTATPVDAVKKTGQASAWVSTDTDACRPYCIDLILVHTPSPTGCGDVETTTFPDFRYDNIDYDVRARTINMVGRCNVTDAVVVRTANS